MTFNDTKEIRRSRCRYYDALKPAIREKLIFQAIRALPRRHNPSPEMRTPESTTMIWLRANLRLVEPRQWLLPERWNLLPENTSRTPSATFGKLLTKICRCIPRTSREWHLDYQAAHLKVIHEVSGSIPAAYCRNFTIGSKLFSRIEP